MKNVTTVKFYNDYSIANVHYTKTPRGKIEICGDLLNADGERLFTSSLTNLADMLKGIAEVQEK